MRSTREARLASLRAAIDEVALAAQAGPGEHADLEELATRLAGLWAMIAELDPGLAARLRGYCPDTSLGSELLPDDLYFDRGGHLGVQPHSDLVRPDGLDRAGQFDPAPVEFRPAGGADRLRDVRR